MHACRGYSLNACIPPTRYGKDLGTYGFEEYTRIKHVMSKL